MMNAALSGAQSSVASSFQKYGVRCPTSVSTLSVNSHPQNSKQGLISLFAALEFWITHSSISAWSVFRYGIVLYALS